ncbi:transposase, partial [Cuniculiplasma sp. SKW4]
FHISYRSSAIFLRNHGEYMEVIGIREILSFQTLSRRAGSFYLHSVNSEITFLYAMELIVAIDSFMIHTCKYSTAARRRVWGNYADPESGWSKT